MLSRSKTNVLMNTRELELGRQEGKGGLLLMVCGIIAKHAPAGRCDGQPRPRSSRTLFEPRQRIAMRRLHNRLLRRGRAQRPVATGAQLALLKLTRRSPSSSFSSSSRSAGGGQSTVIMCLPLKVGVNSLLLLQRSAWARRC